MNDWRTALREGDPAAHAQLSNDDAQAMRRAVLALVPSVPQRVRRVWGQPLFVAATVALMIGTGALAGHRAAIQQPSAPPAEAVATDPGEQPTRQLQFATPGGTRIIWVFNPQFDRNESIP
jgi:hypothetical protein